MCSLSRRKGENPRHHFKKIFKKIIIEKNFLDYTSHILYDKEHCSKNFLLGMAYHAFPRSRYFLATYYFNG